jgi:hypothetical protein
MCFVCRQGVHIKSLTPDSVLRAAWIKSLDYCCFRAMIVLYTYINLERLKKLINRY